MCGIAGVVGVENPTLALERVQHMTHALARRGPDSEGIECWPGVVLGHRRLAIFDLSDAGRQPMMSPDRSLGLVSNGPIYNLRALRTELAADGAQFRSRTDPEVLLHGYRRWGVQDLVASLSGMFAFALLDNASRGHSDVRGSGRGDRAPLSRRSPATSRRRCPRRRPVERRPRLAPRVLGRNQARGGPDRLHGRHAR